MVAFFGGKNNQILDESLIPSNYWLIFHIRLLARIQGYSYTHISPLYYMCGTNGQTETKSAYHNFIRIVPLNTLSQHNWMPTQPVVNGLLEPDPHARCDCCKAQFWKHSIPSNWLRRKDQLFAGISSMPALSSHSAQTGHQPNVPRSIHISRLRCAAESHVGWASYF